MKRVNPADVKTPGLFRRAVTRLFGKDAIPGQTHPKVTLTSGRRSRYTLSGKRIVGESVREELARTAPPRTAPVRVLGKPRTGVYYERMRALGLPIESKRTVHST